MITEEDFETATEKDFATGSRRDVVANSKPSEARKAMIIREASGTATMTASRLASKDGVSQDKPETGNEMIMGCRGGVGAAAGGGNRKASST
jgi:hypothetical protein